MATKVAKKAKAGIRERRALEPARGHVDGKGNFVVVQSGKSHKLRIIRKSKRERGLL